MTRQSLLVGNNIEFRAMTESTHDSTEPEQRLILTPVQEGYLGGHPMMHQMVERDLGPKPPDEKIWMDEGKELAEEKDTMGEQETPAGDNLMDEGEIQETHFC